MPLSAGTRLGPYEILAPIGAGGMGEVYRARDTRLERDVAVKVLPPAFAGDPAALARFEREAKAVAALSHPNILAVHDFGESGGARFAVMELLDGESLRQRLSEGRIPLRKAVEIAREIALGLAAAHEKGIVHRDLKPENLFLTQDGRVKILDFGLARQLKLPAAGDTQSPTVAQGTEPGTVLGTVGYMAPEQLRGQSADHRADIFSFGAVLYEMLSGQRAFRGETAIETMNAILKEEPPELSAGDLKAPPVLERLVSHCLEKRPEERFQSARDLAFDLGSLATATSAAEIPIPSVGRPAPRRLAFAVVGTLGLVVAFLAGRSLSTHNKETPVTFRRLTFRRGNILSARFAPDGQTVVYGAAWEGRPSELFTVRTDSIESRPLGVDHADVQSVSSKGELALVLASGSFRSPGADGTLARVSLGGGVPRELQEHVLAARWLPDNEMLAAILQSSNGKNRLEFPLGHVLEESFLLGRTLAVSPEGGLAAFFEFDPDNKVSICVTDRSGKRRQLSAGWGSIAGLAWSRKTDEILFVGGKSASDRALRAITRSGRERQIWPGAENVGLQDVALDGSLLLERYTSRRSLTWIGPDGSERELGWLDGTALRAISRDGSEILFAETGEGAGASGGVYLRKTDGSPAVRLGDGAPRSLSADGKWVLTLSPGATPRIVLLPTGPGSPRTVPVEGIQPLDAAFLGDGWRIAIFHGSSNEPPQLSVVGIAGGRPKLVAVSGVNGNGGAAFSPDGRQVAVTGIDLKIRVASTDGSAPTRTLPGKGLEPNEYLSSWSADGRGVIAQGRSETPIRLFQFDLQTGERKLWKEIQPADPSGIIDVGSVRFTPDGSAFAYSANRVVSSDLYLVEGLK
jgi:serine/threonine protein kinase/WD40 repeat protein